MACTLRTLRLEVSRPSVRATARARNPSRPWTSTVAPISASAHAVASPMPCVLPVTRQILPFILVNTWARRRREKWKPPSISCCRRGNRERRYWRVPAHLCGTLSDCHSARGGAVLPRADGESVRGGADGAGAQGGGQRVRAAARLHGARSLAARVLRHRAAGGAHRRRARGRGPRLEASNSGAMVRPHRLGSSGRAG